MSSSNPKPVALVTGASSGIGAATAVQLAQAGYHVALVARDQARLNQVAAKASAAHGSDVLVLPGDVGDAQACQDVVRATADRFGRLDALCHVAGYVSLTPIGQITPEIWRHTADVNLGAAALLAAAAWPIFAQQKHGFIGNVSSMASISPFPLLSLYAAAKVGINMLTRCIASEGAPLGIKAVCIAPGAVETPMLRSAFTIKQIPTSHTLTPDSVAQVLTDCALGRRSYTSGETIQVPSP